MGRTEIIMCFAFYVVWQRGWQIPILEMAYSETIPNADMESVWIWIPVHLDMDTYMYIYILLSSMSESESRCGVLIRTSRDSKFGIVSE
jgi:hypothetical protein